MVRAARLAVLVCLVAAVPAGAQAQSAAVSTCGQIVSGDAHLTNDLDCAPTFAGSVIVEGGSLDLRGFTIRGGEVGVLCVHPIWEENVFIYKKCRVFGGTIADYAVAGVAAKHLDVADLVLTGGHGLALLAHKNLRFASVAIDMLPESGNVGLFTLKGTVKGTDLAVQGGVLGVRARKVDIDGMVASGSLSGAINSNSTRLRNALLTGGGVGIDGGNHATVEDSSITGHAGEGVMARKVKLIGSTVTGNGLDIRAEKAQVLEGSTCGTSSGLGVCTDD